MLMSISRGNKKELPFEMNNGSHSFKLLADGIMIQR